MIDKTNISRESNIQEFSPEQKASYLKQKFDKALDKMRRNRNKNRRNAIAIKIASVMSCMK